MAAVDKVTSVKDLRPGMKNVTCVFIVIDRGSTHTIKDGSVVRKCRVADKTGSITFSLWNEQAEAVEAGDILRLVKGYASLWKGTLVLYSGKYGHLEKIGEFTMVFSEQPDMSDTSHDFLQQHQREKETQETGRNGSHHEGSRNSNGHGDPPHGNRTGQTNNSGRPISRLHSMETKRGSSSYSVSPTGDHRPSLSHHMHHHNNPQQQHTLQNSHSMSPSSSGSNSSIGSGGSSMPLLPPSARDNHHHQMNSGGSGGGPLRPRHPDAPTSRYHPYPNRR